MFRPNWVILRQRTCYKESHLFVLVSFLRPYNFVLRPPQTMTFPLIERPDFISVQNRTSFIVLWFLIHSSWRRKRNKWKLILLTLETSFACQAGATVKKVRNGSLVERTAVAEQTTKFLLLWNTRCCALEPVESSPHDHIQFFLKHFFSMMLMSTSFLPKWHVSFRLTV
jgi:hypothetical protein